VVDVPISIETDSKMVDRYKANMITGFKVHDIPPVMSVSKMRDKCFTRIAQARYICSRMLKVGGGFVLKLQHVETKAAILGIVGLSSVFRESDVLRLTSSKNTGTEVYFVGSGYLLGDGFISPEPISLQKFVASVAGNALIEFSNCLTNYEEKVKEKLKKKTVQ